MITIKIDVTKIDKARLYKGAKGTYLSAVLIPTPESEYGDYMIVEDVTKDERQDGKKGTILGNGKIIKKAEAKEQIHDDVPTDTDSLPF